MKVSSVSLITSPFVDGVIREYLPWHTLSFRLRGTPYHSVSNEPKLDLSYLCEPQGSQVHNLPRSIYVSSTFCPSQKTFR